MDMDYNCPPDDFVKSIDVHTLLPQQEPFVMIGQMEHFDMTRVVTSTKIEPGNIFVDNSVMTESGLIENIAQTCAARIGYVNVYILKKGVQIGFIGALKNLEIFALPKVGETIMTSLTVQEEVFGMVLANAAITCNGQELAICELKIALKDS